MNITWIFSWEVFFPLSVCMCKVFFFWIILSYFKYANHHSLDMKQNEANALSDTAEKIVNLENLPNYFAQRNCSIVSDPYGFSEIQLASYYILLLLFCGSRNHSYKVATDCQLEYKWWCWYYLRNEEGSEIIDRKRSFFHIKHQSFYNPSGSLLLCDHLYSWS